MEANFTFDLLVLSPKTGWTIVSRFENAGEAQTQARKLVKDNRHAGVKVLQENFDYAENRFVEKTVFLHTRDGSRAPGERRDEEQDQVDFPDDFAAGPQTRGNIVLVGIAAAVILLAAVLGIGLYFSKSDQSYDRGSGDFFRYDLPTIRTNVSSGEENYSLEITLQLELYKPEHAAQIEADLAPIMESVIEHLQEIEPKDLNNSGRLQYLRAMLRRKIKESIGDKDFNDILFKDIQVRH